MAGRGAAEKVGEGMGPWKKPTEPQSWGSAVGEAARAEDWDGTANTGTW